MVRQLPLRHEMDRRLPLPDPGRKPLVPAAHSFASLAGNIENEDIGVHLASHLLALFGIEIHVGQKVHFVEEHNIGVVEHGRILERLVLALGYAQNDYLVVFTQIEGGRTDKVSHILDQENIELLQVERLKGMADHMGIQMTSCAGVDLPYRNSGGRDPHGIIVGLLVSFDNGEAEFLPQVVQGPLKDAGLAGTGRTDKVQDKNTLAKKEIPVFPRQTVILGKDIGFDSNFPG